LQNECASSSLCEVDGQVVDKNRVGFFPSPRLFASSASDSTRSLSWALRWAEGPFRNWARI
jgi:hypothetical protein